MKRMPNIKLTSAEYEEILLSDDIGNGGEGIIRHGEHPNTAYKIFVEYDPVKPIVMSDNKFKKILSLYEKPVLHSVQPLSTISMNGELIGYKMTYDENDINFDDIKLSRKQNINHLKRISEILKYFHTKEIVYGDVRGRNILINKKTGEIKFCDMDNIQLKDMPVDLLVDYLDSFFFPTTNIFPAKEDKMLDEKADVYMHNLMTIEKIINKEDVYYDDIIQAIEQGIYKGVHKKKTKQILDSMKSCDTFTPEYVVDHMRKIKLKNKKI